MPRPTRPVALQGAVFRTRDVLRDGLLTRDALRSAAWRRLFRGVHVDAEVPDSFGLRVRGARLLAPAAAAFSGRTAAYVHGATAVVDRATPVEVSVPKGIPFGPVQGIRVRRVPLPETDVTQVQRFRAPPVCGRLWTSPAPRSWQRPSWPWTYCSREGSSANENSERRPADS